MLWTGINSGEFPEAIGREEEWIAEELEHHRNPSGPIEQRLADGRWLRAEERHTRDGGIVALRTDITKLKQTETSLKESEERLRDFAESASDWLWEMDENLRFTYMSDNVERIVGVPPEWHYGKTREDLLGDDSDKEAWDRHLKDLRDRKPFRNFEFRRVGEGIEPKWLRNNGLPRFDEDGRFLGYRGTGLDITDYVEAQQELKKSEEKLRQAQKMEAVGQLTGGVAHDFNNLLAIIQGSVEVLMQRTGIDDPAFRSILRATARGAELTQRLLAFSRRQPLRPRALNLSVLVEGMSDLLVRTLGATVQIETRSEPGLEAAMADPGQVENALLNLAINARDAMPDGGRLTIECAKKELDGADAETNPDVLAGSYIVLSVTDTGDGMAPEVLEHATEPFFTTKNVVEGSGLGLSMIYGFAKQSGGHLSIHSEVGKGTTVRLYLPLANQLAPETPASELRSADLRGRNELILVVEDEPDVRLLIVEMVKSLGYRAIEASEASSALGFLRGGEAVDIILTDVVLPGGLSGLEFAELSCSEFPGIDVIFMSGHPAEGARRKDFIGSDRVLLNKPFRKAELAKAIRQTLDS